MNLSLELLNNKKKHSVFLCKSSRLKIEIGVKTLFDTKKMFIIIYIYPIFPRPSLVGGLCVEQLGHCTESLLSRIQLQRDGIYNIPRLYFSVDTGKESRMHCESKH